MAKDDDLSWDEAVEFVRSLTGGKVVLVRDEAPDSWLVWLELTGTEMTVELTGAACNREYLSDVLADWEHWADEIRGPAA
jgi:hypothetical protein